MATIAPSDEKKAPYDITTICSTMNELIGNLYHYEKMKALNVDPAEDPYAKHESMNPLDYIHTEYTTRVNCESAKKGVSVVLGHGYGARNSTTRTMEFCKKINRRDQPVWGLEMVNSHFLNAEKPNLLYLYVYDKEDKIYLDPENIEQWFASLQGPVVFQAIQEHVTAVQHESERVRNKELNQQQQEAQREKEQRERALRAAAKLMQAGSSGMDL